MEPHHYMLAANVVISLAALLHSIYSRRSAASAEWAAKMEASHAALQTRLTTVEGEIRHLPTSGQVNDIRLKLSDMGGELKVLSERTAPLIAAINRVQNFLTGTGE